MPLTAATFSEFIPKNIWSVIKKMFANDKIVTFDLPFKISTKYASGILLLLMCFSLSNQFVRDIDIDCSTNGVIKGIKTPGTDATDNADGLNDYCWNRNTFLVSRALKPEMRGKVTHPGISGYDREKDELIIQRYYNNVWLIFAQLCCAAYIPYFFWKPIGLRKMDRFVNIQFTDDESELDNRLGRFVRITGLNNTFAWYYVGCKLLATISPFAQYRYLCALLGKQYKLYGIDVVNYLINGTGTWPDPMDVIFPKVTQCESSRYGYGGAMEVKSAQCLMPMNNMTQWSFFVYWLYMVVTFFVNLFSLFYLLAHTFPPIRRRSYRKLVKIVCRGYVEQIGVDSIEHQDVIHTNTGFAEWIILSLLKENLDELVFYEFIAALTTLNNPDIQLRPLSPSLSTDEEQSSQDADNEFSIL